MLALIERLNNILEANAYLTVDKSFEIYRISYGFCTFSCEILKRGSVKYRITVGNYRIEIKVAHQEDKLLPVN